MQSRYLIVTAALSMMLAVACGAFGAHALKTLLSPEMLAVWQVGVHYQMLHSMAILVLALFALSFWKTKPSAMHAMDMRMRIRIERICLIMLCGIVLFSGSLYALAVTGIRWLGAITPLGGLAFLIAWAMLAWAAWLGFEETDIV